MRKLGMLVTASALLALAGSPAPTQRQDGIGKMNATMLLNQKPVQEDLKLTEDQIKKVKAAWKKQTLDRQGFRELEREDREKKEKEFTKDTDKVAAGILQADQVKRLRQLSLQQQSPGAAFTYPEVAEALKLTDAQKQKMKEIDAAERKELRKLIKPGGNKEEIRKKILAAVKNWHEQVLALLTPEQKAKWIEMIGAPVKGDLLFGPPGGLRRLTADQ